jgi:hypothetical protein
MPAKILGQNVITSAATNTTIGAAVPAGLQWAFTTIFCNQSSFLVKVRLAIAAASTPVQAEWIIYDREIEPNDTFDITGLVAQATKLVVVQADVANVISVTTLGMESPA